MNRSALEEKTSFEMLWLNLSSKLDWALTLPRLLKLSPRKLEHCSMKFLSPEVALYPHKSTTRPYMVYCCHVEAGASDKPQKQICRTAGPLLARLS